MIAHVNDLTMCNFLSICKAGLTPLIACITVWIAYQQWQDNHLRLKRVQLWIRCRRAPVSVSSSRYTA
jgi:hypothetical protein